jgi:hypothetical protein
VPVFDRLEARCHVVSPERIVHSEYNTAHNGAAAAHGFATLAQMFASIQNIVRKTDRRTYVYAYWPDLDRLAHEHGIASAAAAAHFDEVDAAFAEFLARIAGTSTTVIVRADHGFIDAKPEQEIDLDSHPTLERTLALPLCGERRVAYCYVRPGRLEELRDYVAGRFGALADVHDSRALLESGYFGLGPPHPRLHERIGDCTLIMQSGAVIKDWLPGESRYAHVGVHGGMSAAEMHVPLIVAEA